MVIKKLLLLAIPFALLTSCSDTGGGKVDDNKEEDRIMHDHSVFEGGVDFKSDLWQNPDFIEVPEKDKSEEIKAYYIRSDYKGEESYAFAYLGKPKTESTTLPAVLLLHGGGGTAYYQWVEEWVKRGYVALAIDLEGHTPKDSGELTSYPADLYEKSPYKAPSNSNLGDDSGALEDTWLYYACKTSIIGNSFLHNLSYVNKNKIGVCGVSWGGFITSIITGYDDRLAFSLPIYIPVGLEGSGNPIGGYITSHPLFRPFDSCEPLMNIETPYHLFCSDVDIHCNPYKASELISQLKNASISVIDKFTHSQYDATNLLEPYEYASRILNKEKNVSFTLEDGKVSIKNDSKYKIEQVELFYTEDKVPSTSARWYSEKLTLDENNFSTFSLDRSTSYYYVSVLDEKGMTISSNVLKL